MSEDQIIAVRVPEATKVAFTSLARHQNLTGSALLRRMIDLSLRAAGVVTRVEATTGDGLVDRTRRLTIRLQAEDQLLLRERAAARGMAPATYISVLIRAHLRGLSPLPKDELLAVKRAVAELGHMRRNLNQIARAANRGDRVTAPGRDDVHTMLRICEGLRVHVKSLLLANIRAWQAHGGHREQ